MLIKKYDEKVCKNKMEISINNVCPKCCLLNQSLLSLITNQLLFLYFQVFLTYSKTLTSEAGPRKKVIPRLQPTRNAFLHTITVVKFIMLSRKMLNKNVQPNKKPLNLYLNKFMVERFLLWFKF